MTALDKDKNWRYANYSREQKVKIITAKLKAQCSPLDVVKDALIREAAILLVESDRLEREFEGATTKPLDKSYLPVLNRLHTVLSQLKITRPKKAKKSEGPVDFETRAQSIFEEEA